VIRAAPGKATQQADKYRMCNTAKGTAGCSSIIHFIGFPIEDVTVKSI